MLGGINWREILTKESRNYGAGACRLILILVEIINKKTDRKFNDWVMPDQIKTIKSINNLIFYK